MYKQKKCLKFLSHAKSFLTSTEVEQLLSKIKLTAAGCDGLPAWLLRSYSYELADIVAYILNCSFSTGKVPSYWLNALVTPVPKVSAPIGFSDFRPISVNPYLSRIAKKVYFDVGCSLLYLLITYWISLLLSQVAVLLLPQYTLHTS